MSEKTAKLGSNCNRAGGEGRRQKLVVALAMVINLLAHWERERERARLNRATQFAQNVLILCRNHKNASGNKIVTVHG